MRFFSLRPSWLSVQTVILAAVLSLGCPRASNGIETRTLNVPLDSTHLGVVWTPPEHPGPALRTLDRLHDMGATAVRFSHLPESDTVFARADSLNLHIYIDLPVSHVSAKNLEPALSRAERPFNRIHRLAQRYNSIEYIGLADHADTTVPAACETLTKWTGRVHEMPGSLRTYIVTPFLPATEKCANAVDRPLISTHSRPNPVEHWRAWRSTDSTAGIGTLGTWVDPGASSGLQVPHSPEAQARYLETALSHLLSPPHPPVLFVYRWTDQPSATLPSRRYGLINSSGSPRPAANVMEGFFTGRQQVFAFPDGTAPTSMPIGVILFGWGLAALLAGLYAGSPYFRQTSFRYFRAHGFYLDAVRQGRDVRALVNAALLFVAAGATGTITTLGAKMLRVHSGIESIVATLPSALQSLLVQALTAPKTAGVVVGLATAGVLTLWTTLLTLVARWKQRFAPRQAFMLVVWPFWPVLFGVVLTLVAAANPPIPLDVVAMVLILGGLITALTATVRVLYDYRNVTDIPAPIIAMLAVPSPLGLLCIGLATVVVRHDVPFALLWHLIVHT